MGDGFFVGVLAGRIFGGLWLDGIFWGGGWMDFGGVLAGWIFFSGGGWMDFLAPFKDTAGHIRQSGTLFLQLGCIV